MEAVPSAVRGGARGKIDWRSWSRLLLPLWAGAWAGVAFWLIATNLSDWPPYESRATLLVERPEEHALHAATAESLGLTQSTVAALLVREPIVGQVGERLDFAFDREELLNLIGMDLPDGAPLVEVYATHAEPEVAARVANAVAEEATEIDSSLAHVTILSAAEVPTRPNQSAYLLLGVAVVLGAVATSLVMALFNMRSNRIRSAASFARTDLTLLGEVLASAGRSWTDPSRVEPSLADRICAATFVASLDERPLNLFFAAPREISSQPAAVDFLTQEFGHMLGASNIELVSFEHDNPDGVISDPAVVVVRKRHRRKPTKPSPVENWLDSPALSNGQADNTELVRILDGMPLFDELELNLRIGPRCKVVLLAQRHVTRLDDLETAEQALVGTGSEVLGVFLVG